MRRFSKKTHGAVADINITPLLDLAWVLLVIFIITTTAMVQGIELKLPESTPHETDMESNTPTLSVKKNGDVYLDEERVKLGDLEKLIRDLKAAKGGKLPLVLRGDAGVEYKHVVAVLDILQRIPVEDLALATKPFNEP
ncbi:ExbD/TolR family protein [Candidatus Nitrospira inopinata]|jgi:biopolymer transport protein ExbD|uniref:Biopolymer transport protein ExbD/TolR n=1 Tax=Candidatus Nitrospira inopinata TaxID=1715989 RepID=A0A0S4KU18_9BACT|nr:biopolymer transporter ExbD [Candidatus Nitrospira inopinata]CUQ66654.1 Biopolymer transport protein ExbD/TolR [Candidatus Nitrospira inopinata]